MKLKKPESERMIKLHCADTFGDYTVEGKWVQYKDGKGGRFMTFFKPGNSWMASRKEWDECERWEYLEEKSS